MCNKVIYSSFHFASDTLNNFKGPLAFQKRSKCTNSPEAKLIHGNSKVPGLVITAIKIPVIHGHQVNVAEDEAVIALIISKGF